MGKKIVWGVVAAVVIVAVGAVLFVARHLDSYVADAVETYGSAATGTKVSVGNVDVVLTDARGAVKGLTVGNPQGFTTDYALRIGDIDLALDAGSLTGDVPVIKTVTLNDVHLNAEQRGGSMNLTEIEHYMGQSSGEPETAEPEGRIIIDRFRLTNARVTLTSDLLKAPEEIDLGDVTVNGVGRSSGGATYSAATEALLTPILAAARTAVEDRLRGAATDAARDKLEEKASERLKGLLDRK